MISIAHSASISAHCQIGAEVVFGEHCRVLGNAVVGDRTVLGDHVKVEEGAVIGPDNVIGDGTIVKSGTTIGRGNRIGEYCIVGGLPLISARVEPGQLHIGNENVIREFATIQVGSGASGVTRIGDHNFLMPHVQIGHDCIVGSDVTMTNKASLCGCVTVEDRAVLGLGVTIHQHCRIGTLAMVGATAYVSQDVAPFTLIDGRTGCVVGLNRVGLRRRHISEPSMSELKRAYRLVFRSNLPLSEYCKLLSCSSCPEVRQLLAFIQGSKRGLATARRSSTKSELDHSMEPAASTVTFGRYAA